MGTAVLALVACGSAHSTGEVPMANAEGQCTNDGGASVRYTNPGHTHIALSLTPEQLALAVPGDYSLLAGGTHSHFFNLTAADFQNIQSGVAVEKVDLEGDGHIISITC